MSCRGFSLPQIKVIHVFPLTFNCPDLPDYKGVSEDGLGLPRAQGYDKKI